MYASRNPEDMLSGEHRAGFVRKVYGILAAQMTMTCLICACAMLIPPVRNMFLSMMKIPYASLLIFAPAICVLCALQAKKAEHPTNYYLLWTFTALMSVSIAGICAIYQAAGLGYLILQAFAITAACFVGLSFYAFTSGKSFEWMGGLLSMGLMGMLMFGFLGWMFGFHGGILYSLFGVALFCGYIVYDTHRVLRVYGPDDAILAAIELYLDIVNLFLYILELLASMQSSQR
jgi:FtsH-binding integral membrane protein